MLVHAGFNEPHAQSPLNSSYYTTFLKLRANWTKAMNIIKKITNGTLSKWDPVKVEILDRKKSTTPRMSKMVVLFRGQCGYWRPRELYTKVGIQ